MGCSDGLSGSFRGATREIILPTSPHQLQPSTEAPKATFISLNFWLVGHFSERAASDSFGWDPPLGTADHAVFTTSAKKSQDRRKQTQGGSSW